MLIKYLCQNELVCILLFPFLYILIGNVCFPMEEKPTERKLTLTKSTLSQQTEARGFFFVIFSQKTTGNLDYSHSLSFTMIIVVVRNGKRKQEEDRHSRFINVSVKGIEKK